MLALGMSRSVSLLVVGLLLAPGAWAGGASDKPSADALFAEGRRLMASGSYAAACEKLSASQRIDPAMGTTLGLADCFEKAGRTASAVAELRDAAAAAQAAGQNDRAESARRRAAALEERVSRLTIRSSAVGVKITRDGKPIDQAALGVALPIDAGHYAIEASLPGKKTWSQTIEIKGDRENVTVEVPMLADDPTKPAATVEPEPRPAPMDAGTAGRNQRVLAVGVAAVGVVGLAVGTYAGLRAGAQWSDAKASCRSYPAGCGADSTRLSQDAVASANLSTVAFAVGVAGAIGSVALWLTAPRSPKKTTLSVGISPRAIVVGGAF
jgi:hypothetical protein